MDRYVIGVDIGGSHITCMAVDPRDHVIFEERAIRRPVDCHGTAEEILTAWSTALADLAADLKPAALAGIGFAMPGPFDYPAGIALFRDVLKFDAIYGMNIRDEIAQRLGLGRDIPVRFLNDATCFAIGEAWLGQAAAFRRTVAITLGTGFGSAFVDDGIPVESGDEVPESGCLYHLPFNDSNADWHFSTRWFRKRYAELTGGEIDGVKNLIDNPADAAVAEQMFNEFGDNLGRFLAPWLNRFGAGCLTIGGNIALALPRFEDAMHRALQAQHCNTKVFLTGLGEKAAIAGAARLPDDTFYARLPFVSSR